MSFLRKLLDFSIYVVAILAILVPPILWLPMTIALVITSCIFVVSCYFTIVSVVSPKTKQFVEMARYIEVKHTIFEPVVVVISFCSLCYLLNQLDSSMFVNMEQSSVRDVIWFCLDNIYKVLLLDFMEVYGFAVTEVTHNSENLFISSLVFLFRTVLGFSLFRAIYLFIKKSPHLAG